ncbi:MAG: restriction endonuclease [Micropruina sp.]|nr:restriction endonuclease [Micropruina sp.]
MSSPTLPNGDLPRGIHTDVWTVTGRRFHQDPTFILPDFERVGWQEFERLVGAGFQARGYLVEATQDGADGGVDLNLTRGSERAVVQCKHWMARRVGVSKVRELLGVMQQTGVPQGFIVSSGEFTADAWAEAQRCGIYLMRGADTLVLVNDAITSGIVVPQLVEDPAPGVPRCPICREPMIVRVARKGQNAGSSFWSCPRYPSCRGTRPMPPGQASTPPLGAAQVTAAATSASAFVHGPPIPPAPPVPPPWAAPAGPGYVSTGWTPPASQQIAPPGTPMNFPAPHEGARFTPALPVSRRVGRAPVVRFVVLAAMVMAAGWFLVAVLLPRVLA